MVDFYTGKVESFGRSMRNLKDTFQQQREQKLGQEILRRSDGGRELGIQEIQELSGMYGLPPEMVFQKIAPINQFHKAKRFEKYGSELLNHVQKKGSLDPQGLAEWFQGIGGNPNDLPEFVPMIKMFQQENPEVWKDIMKGGEIVGQRESGTNKVKMFKQSEKKPNTQHYHDKSGNLHTIDLNYEKPDPTWVRAGTTTPEVINSARTKKADEEKAQQLKDRKEARDTFKSFYNKASNFAKGVDEMGQALNISPEQQQILVSSQLMDAYTVLSNLEKNGVDTAALVGQPSSEAFLKKANAIMKSIGGPPLQVDGQQSRQVIRTGTDKKTGRKVMQYDDGTIEYAE